MSSDPKYQSPREWISVKNLLMQILNHLGVQIIYTPQTGGTHSLKDKS